VVWDEVVGKHKGDGPPLYISNPPEGLSVSESRVRYGGCTLPGAQVTMNGVAVRVLENGAFAGLADLIPGENTLSFEAVLDENATRASRKVRMADPPVAYPAEPLRIDPHSLYPYSDLEIRGGDLLVARFRGSPKARAWLEIGKPALRLPMTEQSANKRADGVAGWYEIKWRVPAEARHVKAPLRVVLEREKDKKTLVAAATLKAVLTTDPAKINRTVRTTLDDTGLYADRSTNQRFSSVPKGVRLRATGLVDNLVRVRLDPKTELWVFQKNTEAAKPAGAAPVAVPLSGLRVDPDNDTRNAYFTVSLDWGKRPAENRVLPLRVETSPNSSTLALTLWGVDASRLRAKSFRPPDVSGQSLIHSIECSAPTTQTLVARIYLNSDRSWGHDVSFEEGELLLWVKAAPLLQGRPEFPLEGLKVAIDPGHGGPDSGAQGAAGLRESDINLLLGLRLAALLRVAGARVVLTRETDRQLDLEARARLVAESGADLFISVHNNSVSHSRNPLDFSGPILFFYRGHDIPFADALYEALIEKLSLPRKERGVAWHFFRPLRMSSHMPGVLWETMFLSNPEDEALLLDPAFLDRMTTGFYKGLVEFLEAGDSITVPGDTQAFLDEVLDAGLLQIRLDTWATSEKTVPDVKKVDEAPPQRKRAEPLKIRNTPSGR
jgi:N-acetylmuramoyl-L-alanine amidase